MRVFFFLSSSNWDINSERRPSGTCRSSVRGERAGGRSCSDRLPADGRLICRITISWSAAERRRFQSHHWFVVIPGGFGCVIGLMWLHRRNLQVLELLSFRETLIRWGKKKKKSESTCSPAAVQRAAAWTDGSFLQDDSKDSVRSESEQRSSSHSVSRGDRRFRLFVLAGDWTDDLLTSDLWPRCRERE